MAFKKINILTMHYISIFLALIAIIAINFAMEVLPPHIHVANITHYNDAVNALSKLEKPFSKDEKQKLLTKWFTGNRLLDKGFFQVFVQINNHPKKNEYVTYKLFKYALTVFIELQKLNPIRQHDIIYFDSNTGNVGYRTIKKGNYHNYKSYYYINDFTYHVWQKIYTHIQTTQFKNTEQVAIVCLKIALLLDIQNMHSINYITNITWQEIQNLYYGYTQYVKQTLSLPTFTHILYIDSLLSCFTADDGTPFNFIKIKLWSERDENYIAPVFNINQNKKFMATGLIPIIYSIINGCCLLHFSLNRSTAHNRELQSRTDYIFHDLNHYYLCANNKPNNAIPTSGRKFFFTKTKKILKSLIVKSRNTVDGINTALPFIFSLFFILHEIEPSNNAYDNPNTRISFKKCLDHYFFGGLFDPKLDLNLIISKEKYKDILFNFIDMQKLYGHINKDWQTEYTSLINKKKLAKKQLCYKDAYKLVAPLQFCMLHTLHEFYFKYQKDYYGTIPFLLSNPHEIEALKKLIKLF